MPDAAVRVALVKTAAAYPEHAPFHPDTSYPEYGDRPISPIPNPAYAGVRDLLARLGLDAPRFGTPAWNPLQGVVRPGDRVFIKPNLVTHEVRKSCGCGGDLFSIITHASVVRAVADYAALALEGSGEIVIGDNPSIDADFARILERTRLDTLPRVYDREFGVGCRVLDLRPRWTPDLKTYGFRSGTVDLPGDPEGATTIDLGQQSQFRDIAPWLLRGVFTDRRETIRSHSGGRHEYSISNTILRSDVFISVPKLKAHHKVGATLNVKGLVGICSNKNLLPHWRVGHPTLGGDEYPAAHRVLDHARVAVTQALFDLLPERFVLEARDRMPHRVRQAFARQTVGSYERYRGAWDGNDTCWRMAADLYSAFVADRPEYRAAHGLGPLRTFSVIDGITAGEADGPFCPTPKHAGVLIGGAHLLAVDAAAVRFMDYDIDAVRYLATLLAEEGLDPRDVDVRSTWPGFDRAFHTYDAFGRFKPPAGWPRLSTARQNEVAA